MDDAIRQDLFELSLRDFSNSGYYQLRKSTNPVETQYLDQLLIMGDESTSLPSIPIGFVGVVFNQALYESIYDGDIATINTFDQLRVILSRNANHNTLLVTERCNNLCLFCSQPPKKDFDSWLLTYAAQAVAAFGFDGEIGISGGEPLIYGSDFLRFLDFVSEFAPKTRLHILTNGRAFSDLKFSQEIAQRTRNMRLAFGIPLYASRAAIHDELVGSKGAFAETVTGMINAGNLGIEMEIRFIPTQANMNELPVLVEYISRVFSNVVQLSVMNLEATGWAKKNWSTLYSTTDDYVECLKEAVCLADVLGLHPTLFNFPLCHLPSELRPYAVKSISDWKNYYPDECGQCLLLKSCGGYFTSSRGKYHQQARRII